MNTLEMDKGEIGETSWEAIAVIQIREDHR